MFKTTPLSAGFTMIGILGLIIFSIKLYYNTIDKTWGFLMLIISAIIFISSIISITPKMPRHKDLAFNREIEQIKKEYGLIQKKLDKPKKNQIKKTITPPKKKSTKKTTSKSKNKKTKKSSKTSKKKNTKRKQTQKKSNKTKKRKSSKKSTKKKTKTKKSKKSNKKK